MFKKIGYALLTVAMLGAAPLAYAVTHYDGFDKLSADGLPNDNTWQEVEHGNSYMRNACDSINKAFGSNITCGIDHASWQAFYANELKKPNKQDRVSGHPGQYCGVSGLYYLSEWSAITQNDFQICATDAACKAAFLSKVKATNCVVVESEGEPSLKLENGTLTFVITHHADGDMPNGDGWVKAPLKQLFPEFAKLRPR